MSCSFRLVAIAASTLFCGATAQATPLTASDILSEFNAVISGTFNSGHDVEGRTVANSIASGATFYNNPNATTASSSFAEVNGITIGSGVSSANVNNGGNVNYVTSNAGHFNLNGGGGRPAGTVSQNHPSFAMSDFTTPLNALSARLALLPSNSTINFSDLNNVNFVETPGTSGAAVFNVSATQLETAHNIDFTGSADTVYVNVTGNSFVQDFNFNNQSVNRKIIWNFANATSASFSYWHGTVLAGLASVTNSSPIEGMLYAGSFNGNGELHDYSFNGTVPSDPTNVPEPASSMLLLAGLASLAVLRRNRGRA